MLAMPARFACIRVWLGLLGWRECVKQATHAKYT